MKYFGTDAFAAPLIGIIASLLMLGLGMFYLTNQAKKAKLNGEGYGNHTEKESNEISIEKLPNIFISVLPILIIFASNLFFSKIYYALVDGTYLENFNTTLSNVSGTWSVIISIVIADLFLVITNYKKIKNFQSASNQISSAGRHNRKPLQPVAVLERLSFYGHSVGLADVEPRTALLAVCLECRRVEVKHRFSAHLHMPCRMPQGR